uniref:Dehydrogenase/reductase SDR family member 11 n=1 Tax=Timema douglasi TaxID=61478 RepID=A0A7R8Z936_TIMDO|nr:unnamed protein product [Timema douglasi]
MVYVYLCYYPLPPGSPRVSERDYRNTWARILKALKEQVKDAPGQLHPLKGDVSKEQDILAVFDWTKKHLGGVDILINNAGVGTNHSIIENQTSEISKVFNLNVLGLSICTREAVKSMRERGVDDGHIIHINSIAGHSILNLPLHFYTASKHAVTVLTEGLRRELVALNSHIRVTRTGGTQLSHQSHGEFYKRLTEGLRRELVALNSHIRVTRTGGTQLSHQSHGEFFKRLTEGLCRELVALNSHIRVTRTGPTYLSHQCHGEFYKRLTEGLYRELVALNSNISVTSVNPGNVETEFVDAMGTMGETNSAAYYKENPFLASRDISDVVIYTLSTPKHVQTLPTKCRSSDIKVDYKKHTS